MEKVAIFPLNCNTKSLIDNLKTSNKYEVVAVSSYYEDVAALKNLQEESGIYCDTNFQNCIINAEIVIFARNTMGYEYNGYADRVECAIKMNKKIYIDEQLLDNLKINNKTENIQINLDNIKAEGVQESKKKEIDVPIITIMGMGENCDKFSLQVKIKKEIEQCGYKVLTISANILGEFLGMETLPLFLYSKEISFSEKIKFLNLWIYNKYMEVDPDVILIECPSGILKFSEYEDNFYGEIPMIISNAVEVDVGIVSLYANTSKKHEVLNRLKVLCEQKYNTQVDKFVISTIYYQLDHEWKKIRYYKISDRNQFLENEKCFSKEFSIVNIEEDRAIKEMVRKILCTFENNLFVI